ncbi:RND family efflux transporter MFP subunit [Filimonas zeae]|uniref:MexH family multidrug efflux RND transporter periplasmic adaptor subunit n=1 Tax=Filimonas zeae TaxID=1737353 RepID=A0A917MYD9_9BACT|nr:efflux RND transporter periplasmic adaptor subunit [Filimonas zeae]MDR6339857.1 RND family efflux transporter MFP subunit [Filimonas zeae]GGH69988.1 MexH family multidrug efflux RND transporter periplasmic adaptor subunit [Filimonas zeae]
MGKVTKIIITVIAVAVILFVIARVLTGNKKKNEQQTQLVAEQGKAAIAVRLDTVKRKTLQFDFTTNGIFAAGKEIKFAAEKAGRVTSILVDEGSHVTKGQLLAVIRTDEQHVQLENAEAGYANARLDKERYDKAFQTGGVTQQQVDKAALDLQNAETKLKQARIAVGDASIRSSIDGIINKRFIEPGAVLAPGTELFDIVDVSRLKLQATVTESQVAMIKTGDKVKVTAGVFPDKTFTGTITFIAPKADESLNFAIEIEVSNAAGSMLRAGMYGSAVFSFPQQAPVLVIPRTAFAGSINSGEVFVTDTSLRAQLRKVTGGRVAGNEVEVLNGLQEGELIISSGQINLANGTAVQPVK